MSQPTPPTPVTGDATFQTEVLEEMSSAVQYRRWLVDLTAPHLGRSPIEIGSGTGDYAQDWASRGITVTATEGFQPLVDHLHDRFQDESNVTVQALMAPVTASADHSAVVALNVLEHIPDDVEALRSFAGLVLPGGAIVMFVPAFPALMSPYDRVVGHQRRYTRRTLRAAAEQAGLRVEVLHHVNIIGFFGWFLTMRILKGRPQEGLLLQVFDRGIVPVLRRLEARVRPPFGQSLLLVARTPDQPDHDGRP